MTKSKATMSCWLAPAGSACLVCSRPSLCSILSTENKVHMCLPTPRPYPIFFFSFQAGSHHVVSAILELTYKSGQPYTHRNLLPLPPLCWDQRYVLPYMARSLILWEKTHHRLREEMNTHSCASVSEVGCFGHMLRSRITRPYGRFYFYYFEKLP